MSARGAIVVVALLAAACRAERPPDASAQTPPRRASPGTPELRPQPHTTETLAARLEAIDEAVQRWRDADSLAAARRNAEAARNLVVGRDGPLYGDADKDGEIAGASEIGLLPGLGRQPGLASAPTNGCVSRDVLGGEWDDPAQRWRILGTAIANWRPANNTFPKLPSHPQHVVGWATLTLAVDDLATARDYAAHAQLHVDISKRAVRYCAG